MTKEYIDIWDHWWVSLFALQKKFPHKIRSESEIREGNKKMCYEKKEVKLLCPSDRWAGDEQTGMWGFRKN